MKSELLLCPECRARVLADWSECKFCGMVLEAAPIAANPHPDDLVEPPSLPDAVGALPSPPIQSDEEYDWSTWVNDSPTHDETAPDSGGLSVQGTVPGDVDHPGLFGGGSLEPHPTAGGIQWQQGPAPVQSSIPAQGDVPVQGDVDGDDQSPSGLEPVSWYVEPSGDIAATPVDPARSLFGGGPSRDPEREPTDDAPPPPDTAATGQALRPTGSIAAPWEPAQDGWASGAGPADKPTEQSLLSREARMLLIAITLVVVLGVTAFIWRGQQRQYPAEWAGNIQPIATFVATNRAQTFKHPIPVVVMSSSQYAAALTESENPPVSDDRLPALRALGLVKGSPQIKTAASLSVLGKDGAYYDLRHHRLVLEQGSSNVANNTAIAAALSLALDDQWNGLGSLANGSLDDRAQLTNLSGTAMATSRAYVASLSPAKRAAYDYSHPSNPMTNWDPSMGYSSVYALAPARLGQPVAQFIGDSQGAAGLADMVAHPPASDVLFLDPALYLTGRSPISVATPAAPAKAKIQRTGTLGATALYLMLAGRIPALDALGAAQGWGGDSYVTYRMPSGTTCISLVIRTVGDPSSQSLNAALARWQSKLKSGDVTVRPGLDDTVTIDGCDPGVKADPGASNPYALALALPTLRWTLAAGYYLRGTKVQNGPNGVLLSPTDAACLADVVVQEAPASELGEIGTQSGPVFQQATRNAAPSCSITTADQLF